MLTSFLRILKIAWLDFLRNIWLSLVTITILVLALFSINVLVSLNAISQQLVQNIEDKVDVSIELKDEVTQAEVDNLQLKFEQLPEVSQVTFIGKDQALENFKLAHQDDPQVLESVVLLDYNPLPRSLVIQAKDTDSYEPIIEFINNPEFEDIIAYKNISKNQQLILTVNKIRNKVSYFGLGITALFVLIAILIVFNSIRIIIYTHRDDIGIMRLVGATNWFIRVPFLVEALFYSFFAIILSTGVFYFLLNFLQPALNDFLGLSSYGLSLVSYFNSNFLFVFGGELLIMVILSVLSSGVAIRRYLKV